MSAITRKRSVLVGALLLLAWGGVAMAQTGNLAKIDPELQERIHNSRDANEMFRIIIVMTEQYNNPNLERSTALMTRAQRRDYVVDELKRFSEVSQTEVVAFLAEQSTRGQVNVLHRFWIFNGIYCEATANSIDELSSRYDVRYISLDKEMEMIEPEPEQGLRGNPPNGVQWHASKIRAHDVWNILGYSGAGVVVAIIDSGVNYDHADISANMWDGGTRYPHHGWDFYNNDDDPIDITTEKGHGTHVAGIVAGGKYNSNYKVGIAPNATIMALKVFGDNHSEEHKEGPTIQMVCSAVEFAVENGADVLNLSLGIDGVGGVAIYRDLFVNVMNAGVVATVSAGNAGEKQSIYPIPFNIGAPGNCPPPWHNPNQVSFSIGEPSAVICVGATTKRDKHCSFSSVGPTTWMMGDYIGDYNDYLFFPESQTDISGLVRPDLSAPGSDIWSLSNDPSNTKYSKKSGTSMSAPCVAGVIALMLEANPYLTPAKIDEILETTAVACGGQTLKNNKYGAGRVDAATAVIAARDALMQQQCHISVAKYPFRDCFEVQGTGHYHLGDTDTLIATPSDRFLRWEKNGEFYSNASTTTFTVSPADADAQFVGVFRDDCKRISVTADPSEAGFTGYYEVLAGETFHLSVETNEGYLFDYLTLNDTVVSRSPDTTFVVTRNLDFVSHYQRLFTVTAEPLASIGGITEGGGTFLSGETCTVTATPIQGFAFIGWYNDPMCTILVSRQPEYTFTVTGDRHLYALFDPKDYTVTISCTPTNGGTVAGGGTYMAYSTVTLIATPNSGYVFNCWTEDGEVVSTQSTYSFSIHSNRQLVANFMKPAFFIGDVITNSDGSKGVVFYTNPTYTGGYMVALEDVSVNCAWGTSADVPFLRDYTYTQNECLLSDMNGYANTEVIRNYQSANTNYASGKVDFENGWYVPSAGQLRKLFGALPYIEVAMRNAGGTTLSDNGYYWSSTENSASSAWAVSSGFEMYSYSKTSSNKVRPVHDFSFYNTMRVQLHVNNTELGTVTGSGFYANGATVTVTATPTGNNLFRGWTEDGHLVSQDPTYTFSANANRDLVANFAIRGGVGTLVNNPDGSQGVLFYLNDDGSEGWMVALEDASEGCQWGPSSDVTIMKDRALNDQTVLRDQEGFYNTWLIRISQGTDNGYAASVVDFDNGWYLPSSGQLRKLYAEFPLIEEAIIKAGGSIMTDDKYWSSTEYSSSYAFTPGFEISYTSKSSNCRVRAIRNYHPAGDNVVLVASNEDFMGTASVSGSGVFAQNQTVTVTATPNVGYQFDHWTENGATVSYDAEYQFPFTRSRSLVAHFVVPGTIGSVIHNLDGSIGVVFYVNDEGTEGLMVALEDASSGCNWGNNSDILVMPNEMFSGPFALRDNMGAENTSLLRICQGTGTSYAANTVDVDHGWFIPSSGQLRKLYAALPLIEEQLVFAGGSLLTTDSYWSSTEYSSSNAFSPMFEMTNLSKTTNHRVRAVRSFLTSGVHSLAVKANNTSFGSVTGSGNYGYGATVTVTAVPNVGFAFDHWTEDGATVSYDATYQFTFTRNRSLVAHFVRPNSVGHIVTSADGSKGLVFYSDPSGNGSLIVALEDASSGCAWGDNQDVLSLTNQAPGYVQRMLEDMNGSGNSNALRTWQNNNPNYAVSQMDYANEWYLPSAGQLRKLYAALPLIEKAMVNAGGTLMSDNAYWSSSENASNYAWSPSFEFTKTNKTSNLRVRAIRGINTSVIPSITTQTLSLSSGWNYVSIYVDIALNDLRAALVEALPGTVITIKQQNGTTSYDPARNRWIGNITWDLSQMYEIKITASCEITLEGARISPSEHTVTIKSGNNWIAFPFDTSMSVTNAFAGFAVNGDMIKSKDGTTTYTRGRWVGTSLTTLEPGKGYVYKSAMSSDRTFTFPTNQGKASPNK